MKRQAAIVAGVVLGLAVAAFAQGPRRDGRWEVKMEMNMPGMPGMPPMTTTQCITPEDAADPQKSMPSRGRGDNGNCKVSDYKIDGNKVTWSMECTGAQAMTGKGEFVYAADTYTGTMTMDMSGRGSMSMKYSGKRLGDCTK